MNKMFKYSLMVSSLIITIISLAGSALLAVKISSQFQSVQMSDNIKTIIGLSLLVIIAIVSSTLFVLSFFEKGQLVNVILMFIASIIMILGLLWVLNSKNESQFIISKTNITHEYFIASFVIVSFLMLANILLFIFKKISDSKSKKDAQTIKQNNAKQII